ncbi:hypothetical protein D9619_007020 [Psilocybe cf. subviscida]|uniref:Septation initiation network scaffold protein cdc11 n=1 Tax=Psilocybe cf. subviscida TaxID=2480587 RepID=A0A8H5B2T1_9AGAR|nr:hypothetical protein D9619_007020 [Psilocybe cf. subviscida]
MSSAHAQGPPAWQTEELQDEWPDSGDEEQEEEEDDGNNMSYGTQSVSFTVALSTQIHTTADLEPDPTPSSHRNYPAGTFLVREEIEHAPLLPKTPGANNKKGAIKDFFTPMPLERMFEPPSPPIQPPEQHTQDSTPNHFSNAAPDPNPNTPSQSMEDEIVETDMPNMSSFHGRKPTLACQFTFSVPRPSGGGNIAFAQAQSTPNPPLPRQTNGPPPTDPRLRLFQFQYDTYTREHLSALVDSIAVNTPSGPGTGTTATPDSFGHGLSRVSEASGIAANMSHLRSTKRLKLSPSSDLCMDAPREIISIARPKIFGKDYVGESRNLMQQIKLARDFSTISSVASGQNNSPSYEHINESRNDALTSKNASTPLSTRRPSFLSIPEQNISNPSTSSGTIGSKANSYSSISYRQKAEALMGQIKGDMKRHKRIFSGDSELSHVTTHVEEDTNTSTAGSLKKGTGREHHRRPSSSTHRRTSSLKKSSSSPMKVHKSQVDDTDLVHNLSKISIHAQPPAINITLIPPSIVQPQQIYHESEQPSRHLSDNVPTPAYPSTSIRITTNEDLNRFVSSSTASGTTVTAGSVPSFTKHPGPAQIRTIAPGDLPTLPERFGDMLFDKVMMRWVKNTANATMDQGRSANVTAEVSDDPFGDIESLRDDSRPGDDDQRLRSARDDDEGHGGPTEMSIIEEQSEVEDEEEIELSNFSTDASAHIVDIMAGVDTDGYEDETTDSEDDDLHTATRAEINDIDLDSDYEDSRSRIESHLASPAGPSPRRQNQHQRSQQEQPSPGPPRQQQFLSVQAPVASTSLSTPNRGNSGTSTPTPIKSALKSGGPTPTSVLRSADRRHYQTPLSKSLAHRRSVSFSDGKREGPIQGISIGASGGAVQSTRSKRIADIMNALEDSDDGDEDESPSKTSTLGRPEELQPLHARKPSTSTAGSKSPNGSVAVSPRRVFSRSYSQRASPRNKSKSMARANGTFLTECSFGVAHDRLVEVITDVQPFEPHWEELASIDLSDAKLESVARLKEFLPRLDALSLNRNELAWLSGIPATVRTLSVANNCLTGITSYSHLLNLENLDISHNDIESLRQLECLRHLRELKADGNKISALDGLQRMDGLVKLSLQANKIKEVDLTQYRWTRLEMLNASHNRVERVHGLGSLQSLIALNLDMNSLPELLVSRDGTGMGSVTMPRLRILRVSGNKLQQLDVGALPNLRTLYADNNALERLGHADRLGKLENLSLRNQSGKGL